MQAETAVPHWTVFTIVLLQPLNTQASCDGQLLVCSVVILLSRDISQFL